LSEAAIDRARYYGQNTYCSDSAPNIEHLTQTKSVPIGESIYDLKWYPSAAQGTTPCFVSTSRDHPIMLWDVGDQHTEAAVRCTYRGYDHNDEIAAAVSLGFNLTGDKLYAGYNRMIR
jgi:WD40 repeat protein